jgi:hypothetical protein
MQTLSISSKARTRFIDVIVEVPKRPRHINFLDKSSLTIDATSTFSYASLVFSKIVLIISFPTFVASAKRGSKYLWIVSNFSR